MLGFGVARKRNCAVTAHGTAGALDGTCLLRRAAGSTMPLYSTAFFLQHSSVPACTATVHQHFWWDAGPQVTLSGDHPEQSIMSSA